MTEHFKKNKRMEPYQVLVIEDQAEIINYCRRYLADGFAYDMIRSGKQIEFHCAQKEYDLVLLDKNFSHLGPEELLGPPHRVAQEGIEILKRIKSIDSNLPVIMITGFGDEESVSAAFRLGAFDYIEAEILTKDEMILRRKMENAISGFSARSRELVEKYNQLGLIGRSPAMVELFRKIENAVRVDSTVLLLGEPGVGKDIVARVIHKLSGRSGKFIPFDMTQTSLLETSLFGIKKKSATLVDERTGFLKLADGGTLFLNEIGELPLDMQSKLLVSLEDREYFPIGSTNKESFDARIVAATNKDLTGAVKQGTFRADLFGRLNQIKITVPSLAKRKEDISLLVRHFIDHYCTQYNIPPLEVTDKALKLLGERHRSNNVRELKYEVEQLVNVSDGIIGIKEAATLNTSEHDVKPLETLSEGDLDFGNRTLLEIEKEMMLYYLCKFDGYVKPAHEAMKISKAKFYSRINQYSLKHLVRGYSPQD